MKEQTQNKSRWPAVVVMAVVGLIVLAGLGQWWATEPKRTVEHFVALLSAEKYDEARAMLADPTSLQSDTRNGLQVRASNGATESLSRDELPLMAGGKNGFRSRHGLSDYLARRYHFQISNGKTLDIVCMAEGGRVVLREIQK